MAEPISIQQLKDASLDVKSLEEVVNGNDTKQVTTRLGESYPSVKKAIKTLFENGSLPATPFATKALMEASALVDGDYAMVTDDTVNNGLYVKTAGAWVKSEYDPLTQAKADATTKADTAKSEAIAEAATDATTKADAAIVTAGINASTALSEVVGTNTDNSIIHGFVDADLKLVAYIDDKGEFDFHPTNEAAERSSKIKENLDGDFVYLLLDNEGRVLTSVDIDGRRSVGKYIEEVDSNEDIVYAIIDEENRVLFGIDKNGNQLPKTQESVGTQIPNKTPLADITSSVSMSSVKSFYRVIKKLDLKTTGLGKSEDVPIEINGDGLTHPKMVYVPQGWNGYKYWLAATPTFGVTPPAGGRYENPHVWASNDLETWVEPSGGRIDAPDDGDGSYWSDTHLALDDDGWMYCFYRGNGFSFGSRCVVAKRSRDGVSWSDRFMIYNADVGKTNYDSGLMSPAFFKNNSRWMCVDVVAHTTGFPIPKTNYGGGRAVFKRASNNAASDYEDYDQSQIVNYLNREWGEEKEPWHIDAIQVGNLHLHLINAVDVGLHTGQVLYLAWSNDGWNFNVLPRLETGPTFNIYRSSISVKEVRQDEIDFDVIVARRDGTMDLYKLTLEVN